jgi:heme-degrading monooxygenase HmoA
MFARVQTVHQPADRLDALAKLAGEQLAAAPELPGFRDLYYLVDRENGKALVITLWETEADLRRLEENNAALREQVKAEARIDSPAAEIFEVAATTS